MRPCKFWETLDSSPFDLSPRILLSSSSLPFPFPSSARRRTVMFCKFLSTLVSSPSTTFAKLSSLLLFPSFADSLWLWVAPPSPGKSWRRRCLSSAIDTFCAFPFTPSPDPSRALATESSSSPLPSAAALLVFDDDGPWRLGSLGMMLPLSPPPAAARRNREPRLRRRAPPRSAMSRFCPFESAFRPLPSTALRRVSSSLPLPFPLLLSELVFCRALSEPEPRSPRMLLPPSFKSCLRVRPLSVF